MCSYCPNTEKGRYRPGAGDNLHGRRGGTDEPGPSQVRALEARKHTATLHQRGSAVTIELRWCPAHKGCPGTRRQTSGPSWRRASPPPTGVESLGHGDRHEKRRLPPRSLAHLKRSITETKWKEAKAWVDVKVTHGIPVQPEGRREDGFRPTQRQQAARLEVLPVEYGTLSHWSVTLVGEEPDHRQVLVVPVQGPDAGAPSRTARKWERQQKNLWAELRRETGRGKDRFKVQDLFTDERCSQTVVDFLTTADVGRRLSEMAEEDTQSEASDWGVSEWEERRREEAGGWRLSGI